jgi:hypothetical protein
MVAIARPARRQVAHAGGERAPACAGCDFAPARAAAYTRIKDNAAAAERRGHRGRKE